MPAITFPTRGSADVDTWTPYLRFVALDARVAVMARSRIEGAWAAYVTTIPGQNHQRELVEATFDYASKLPEQVARAIFGEFDGIPYAE